MENNRGEIGSHLQGQIYPQRERERRKEKGAELRPALGFHRVMILRSSRTFNPKLRSKVCNQ